MQRPFQAYAGDDPYIFVCYAHNDRTLVYPEISRLRESGFNIWHDEGITPGSEWSEALARQIRNCSVFLYFVTPRSVASEHARGHRKAAGCDAHQSGHRTRRIVQNAPLVPTLTP